MLASVSFPSCFVTFYSSGRSLLPFLKSWFLNYSSMFTFYGLYIYIYIYCFTQKNNTYYDKKPQSLTLTMHTVLNCKPLRVLCHVYTYWLTCAGASLAWSLTNNIVVFIGGKQTKPNHSNPKNSRVSMCWHNPNTSVNNAYLLYLAMWLLNCFTTIGVGILYCSVLTAHYIPDIVNKLYVEDDWH